MRSDRCLHNIAREISESHGTPRLSRFAESKLLFISFSTTPTSSGHFSSRLMFLWQRSIIAQESFDVDAIKLESQRIDYSFGDIFNLPLKLALFRRLLNLLCTTKQSPGEGRTRSLNRRFITCRAKRNYLIANNTKNASHILPVAGLEVRDADLFVVGGFVHGVKVAVKNQFRKTMNRDIL